MIQAIVYTSNTGSTERYAKLLGHETDLPVCSLDEAKKALKSGTEIIYLGWIIGVCACIIVCSVFKVQEGQ